MTKKIVVEAVSKVFEADAGKPVPAVRDISFSVGDDEIVCLLGPSGCGKTTVLNMIAGFERPSTGRVLTNATEVSGPGPDRVVVFQSPALFPWLTVLDNIIFGPRHHGVPHAKCLDIAREIIHAIGLSGFEGRYPYQLSGGMRQRVALGRALVNRPQALLLDEPFGALDAQTRLRMQELLLAIWEKYRFAVVFITHDVEEAIFLADRILVFTRRPGCVKAEIGVDIQRPRSYEVLTSPEFVRLKRGVLDLVHSEAELAGDSAL